jgi:mono/diheme cytochrome c family protein
MKLKVVVVVLVLAAAAVGLLAFWIRSHGFSAREQPSRLEQFLAQNARRLAMPSGAKGLKNPEPVNEATLAEAREHYVAHCSVCHGLDGRGDTAFGRNMYPKVPDLTKPDTQRLADGELYYVVSNGVRFTGMPAFGGEDSPESIWHLVSFLRRLPQLPPEELKRMREMAEGSEPVETASPQPEAGRPAQPPADKTGQGQPTRGRKPARPRQHGSESKPHQH